MAISAAGSASRNEPRSQYVADSNVQPFLQRDFDPANYLNNALPPLSVSSTARNASNRAVPLSELSIQLQTVLSQLNAQTSRLSNTLTQLTDEIIRSGGRLAYEVEVLRGETSGLTDALDNGLRKDIEVLAPKVPAEPNGQPSVELGNDFRDAGKPTAAEPESLERLRTLALVRSRLDSVIRVFGDAMAWPMAPSETSSLISISAPENDADARDREEKGKAYAEKLRNEINELVESGNDVEGLEAAAARVEELQDLAEVWKGTAEEKARLRLVESLQRPVDERLKALNRTGDGRKPAAPPSQGIDYRYGGMDASKVANEGGYGFLQNLRNLKNEMYLE